MNNTLMNAIYTPLLILTAIICIIAFVKDRGRPVIHHFIILCLLCMGWQAMGIAYFSTTDADLSRFFYDAKLPFVAFSAVEVLILSYNFYSPHKRGQRTFAVYLLCVVPLITSCLALTSMHHNLIRTELVILQTAPTHISYNIRGIWFWIHSAYSYIAMLAAMFLIFINHKKLPKEYKTPSALLVIGIIIAISSNILVISNIIRSELDLTLMGISISLIFVYAAIITNDQAGFLVHARNEIFGYINQQVFILDNSGIIIDQNPAAKAWLSSMHVGHINSFHTLTDNILHIPASAMAEAEEPKGLDVSLAINGVPFVYNLHKQPIRSGYGGPVVGMFAIFTNVTSYKQLIDQLEHTTRIDPLTHLDNRHSYDLAKTCYDKKEYFPLSIIVGDVNGLKSVNDHFGHDMGDKLLQTIAQILAEACRESQSAYRVGGDEFILLLPKTSNEQAMKIARDITDIFSKIQRYPFRVAMAFGVATKSLETESLDQLINQADSEMYRQKGAERLSLG